MRLQPRWIKDIVLKKNRMSIFIGLGVAALILARLTQTLADPDLWGYMSFGRLFWQSADFPYRDIFSYTPVKTLWVYHEWLTGVLFYPVYQNLGAAGLQGLKYLLGLATAFFIYKTARTRGASARASLICLLLISPFFSFSYSPLRAQIFTNLFFVLTFYILERSQQFNRPRDLGWLIPIFLLWANLHGGFVAGLGMIGLFAAGRSFSKQRSLPYWLILAPATAVTLINPYGLKYWIYLVSALLMPRPDIDEWHSVLFALLNGEFSTNILSFIILFVLAFLMLVTSRKHHITDILLITVTAFLAFKHLRHQSLFFVIVGACGPVYLTRSWDTIRPSLEQTDRWKKIFNVSVPILFLFLFFFFGAKFIGGNPFDLALRNAAPSQRSDFNYPVGAVEFLKRHNMKGNILTEFSWGEYIIWSLPDSRVAMDGRYETVYTDESGREYFEFMKGKTGWRDYLGKYPHQMILLRPDSVVSALLLSEPHWRVVYSDPDCVVFIRKPIP